MCLSSREYQAQEWYFTRDPPRSDQIKDARCQFFADLVGQGAETGGVPGLGWTSFDWGAQSLKKSFRLDSFRKFEKPLGTFIRVRIDRLSIDRENGPPMAEKTGAVLITVFIDFKFLFDVVDY